MRRTKFRRAYTLNLFIKRLDIAVVMEWNGKHYVITDAYFSSGVDMDEYNYQVTKRDHHLIQEFLSKKKQK